MLRLQQESEQISRLALLGQFSKHAVVSRAKECSLQVILLATVIPPLPAGPFTVSKNLTHASPSSLLQGRTTATRPTHWCPRQASYGVKVPLTTAEPLAVGHFQVHLGGLSPRAKSHGRSS